MKTIVEESAW